MQFRSGHAEVLAEGFTEQVAGSIAASGKAFKGLIDGLYSRKVEAIIRELSTNAFDGQKMAGYVGAFDVHLPTALSPIFWVRDYGCGMTHYHMMKRYPVLFDSTKDGLNPEDAGTNPNDQVGCLGLGSKSFFAYTDACTITIWQGGAMRVYAVYMGGDGIIQIALAGSAESDERDGVKVEFAVKTKDFAEFQNAAIRVFKGFPIQPSDLPIAVRDALAVEPLQVGQFWKAFPKEYLPGGGFYARQGCVLYPIDLTQVDAKVLEDADGKAILSAGFERFAKAAMTVVIDFPIGSIGFDLSRERLSYDDATVMALRGRWEAFDADLQGIYTNAFAKLSSAFERMQAATTDTMKAFGPLFSTTSHWFEADSLRNALLESFPKNQYEAAHRNHPFVQAIKRYSGNGVDAATSYRHRQQWGHPDSTAFDSFIIIYVDKAKANQKSRIARHLAEHDIKWAFVINKGKLTLKQYREWGCPPITRMSDIALLPKVIYAKGDAGDVRERQQGVFDRFKFLHNVNDCYAEPPENGVDDLEDHFFALINKGNLLHEDEDVTGHLEISDVMLLHRVLFRTTARSITFINTRTNDAEGKWDEFPRYYSLLETMVDQMPPAFIKRIINVMNEYRFRTSQFIGVYRTWSKHIDRGSRDPISMLRRFDDRLKGMSGEDRQLFEQLLWRSGHNASSNKRLTWFLNQVIERGRKMGLEVLPKMGPANYANNTEGNHKNPLFNKRWWRVAKIVAATSSQKHDDTFIVKTICKTLLKDNFPC